MNDLFTLSSGQQVAATETVDLSSSSLFDARHVPEDKKLVVTVTGIIINERKEGIGSDGKLYVQEENIGVQLLVTEKGEFFDFEQQHKLQINDNTPTQEKDLLARGILTKADKAKTTLMTYDAISGGNLTKAANAGQDPYDVGVLNRAFNGMEFTATFGLIENKRKKKAKDEATGKWTKPVFEADGVTPVMEPTYTNWIKGLEPKTHGSPQTGNDNIVQQATNQPNAPVPDAINIQPQVQQPIAPQDRQPLAATDIPF